MKYFAYGSKMLGVNMRKLVPDAKHLGIALLDNYQVNFTKLDDGCGGRCNITPCPEHRVYGVLWDIPACARTHLDKSMQLGFEHYDMMLKVHPLIYRDDQYHQARESVFAFTYLAHKCRVRDNLTPTSGYRDSVLQGAQENHFPASYIKQLSQYGLVDERTHCSTLEP